MRMVLQKERFKKSDKEIVQINIEREEKQMAKIYATKSPEMSEREKRNMERSRRIAAQGMVLLEND